MIRIAYLNNPPGFAYCMILEKVNTIFSQMVGFMVMTWIRWYKRNNHLGKSKSWCFLLLTVAPTWSFWSATQSQLLCVAIFGHEVRFYTYILAMLGPSWKDWKLWIAPTRKTNIIYTPEVAFPGFPKPEWEHEKQVGQVRACSTETQVLQCS